jgi:hypothetical protein
LTFPENGDMVCNNYQIMLGMSNNGSSVSVTTLSMELIERREDRFF